MKRRYVVARWSWIGARALILALAWLIPIESGTGGVGEALAAVPGTAAPDFELVTFAGEVCDNRSLKGRPVLLVFWAPWCKVCRHDLPLMGQFYRQDRPALLRVVAVGFADTRTNVEAFVKARPGDFAFPVAYDEDRWVARAFRITATPTYVLVDAGGQVLLVHRGGGLLQNVQFREFLATLKE
jgi:thiol-disulfide isomerase/thioredoxin